MVLISCFIVLSVLVIVVGMLFFNLILCDMFGAHAENPVSIAGAIRQRGRPTAWPALRPNAWTDPEIPSPASRHAAEIWESIGDDQFKLRVEAREDAGSDWREAARYDFEKQ